MGELVVKRRVSKNPQVGDLRYRISIYSRSITPPDFSAEEVFTQAHTLIATVWASINTLNPFFTFDGVDPETKNTHEFVIRYRSDVKATNIIKYDGQSYKINKIDPADGRKRFLFLKCELLGDDSDQVNR